MVRRISPVLLVAALSAVPTSRADSGELPAPTGVEASDGAYSTKVGVCWNHIRDATTYQVFRSTTENPASAASVGTTSSVIFYDSTAVPDQTYHYWVRAENGDLKSLLSVPDQGFRAQGINSRFGPIKPLDPPPEPPENPVTGAKVYLGKTLFWDEQLSSTRTVACGTCHLPSNGGSDPRSLIPSLSTHPSVDGVFGTDDDIVGSPGVPLNRADGTYVWSTSFGFQEQVTHRKAQSVINAAYCTDKGCDLLWDGRADQQFKDPITGNVVIESGAALESQALIPLLNDTEMSHQDAGWDDLVARLSESQPLALSPAIPAALSTWVGDRGYPELFSEAFGAPEITPVRIAMAIAAYERTLYSDRTPLDAIVSGIKEEPPAEKRGRELFFEIDCNACHLGPLLSDGRFRSVGLRPASENRGRSEVTASPFDFGAFRTPSLRNVALRAPYMHNGRLSTLEEVVDFYDRGGDIDPPPSFIEERGLTAQQKSDLVAFLRNQLTDPRVESEAGPLFDRPMLYSESARVPRIIGADSGADSGPDSLDLESPNPQVQAIEPPLAGNPSFTVGLFAALRGAQAVLVIDDADPGVGPGIPASASFARRTVTAANDVQNGGYASLSLPIPNDSTLIGSTLFGRWFVQDGPSVSATPAFEMTVFEAARPPVEAPVLYSLSAASLALGFVAPESIVSGFGVNLSTATESAGSIPLPTTLAGVTVLVRDRTGSERLAPLFYVSPGQLNYQVPPGTAIGEATVSVLGGGNTAALGNLQVAPLAPALFAANADGKGPAGALALRVGPDNSQTYESVARFDQTQNSFVSLPIDLGPESDQVFLVLFGTGIRFAVPGTVTAKIGGMAADVLYAGAHGELVGADQVNLPLSRSLAGRGQVDVFITVDGQTSNTVRVSIQ